MERSTIMDKSKKGKHNLLCDDGDNSYCLIPLTIRLTRKEYKKICQLADDDDISISRLVGKMTNTYFYNKYTVKVDRENMLSTDQKVSLYKYYYIYLNIAIRGYCLKDILYNLQCMDNLIPLDKVSSYRLQRYDQYKLLLDFMDNILNVYPIARDDEDYINLVNYFNSKKEGN